MATKKTDDGEITILEIRRETIDVCILGETPLILNRMSEKAKRELLMPKGKKNAAEKASSLKHDPLAEFRESPYIIEDNAAPTYLAMLSTAFKGAMRQAALDMPGANKSQIGRLVYVPGEMISIYGVPRIFTSITRSADMKRTPDPRTRCIVPKWAAQISITYTIPLLNKTSVGNLLAAAGKIVGVGDWRQEKGSGNYGLFRLVEPTNAEFLRIKSEAGRAAQIAAMDDPEAHDKDSADLLSWFDAEVKRRGFRVAA